MAQQFSVPITESDLRRIQDEMFAHSKKCINMGVLPKFKSLIEIASAETTIITAIHNIKGNKGSQTTGSDNQKMKEDILQLRYSKVINKVKNAFQDYKPKPVKRVFIPKPGKSEKRPIGIPAIIDRIIQECIRMIIEPICEAQFFNHSYGFRPWRDAHMAISRMTRLVQNTGYNWIVEGDISKFFDSVNHRKMLAKLYHMGIRDQRMLMIIKKMLKAGVMGKCITNNIGTPQGGIISLVLANIYLDTFDKSISKSWENKNTNYIYSRNDSRIGALKKKSNLKPAYLVRYADDWILLTNSKRNAEKWKYKIGNFLKRKLKLTLSREKTKITNIRKNPIHFLGFEYKVVKGKSRTGSIPRTMPDRKRLNAKINELHKKIKHLKKIRTWEILINQINLVNSIIRGIINYFQPATWVNVILSSHSQKLSYAAYKALRRYNGRWNPANEVNNLTSVHENYRTKIPTIEYEGIKIGVTNLSFCRWKIINTKKQDETPYTKEGRKIHMTRTNKKPLKERADELLSLHLSKRIALGQTHEKYNFEYFMNRAYAFNRDKGKCKICGNETVRYNTEIHHINPNLPLSQVNCVSNLATTHDICHKRIHNNKDYSSLDKTWKKILKYREKLKSQ